MESKSEIKFSEKVYPINVFDLSSSFRGNDKKMAASDIKVLHSKGFGFIPKSKYIANENQKKLIGKYKVVVSRTVAEHANEPSKDGTFKVISKSFILNPNEICTHSYLIIASFESLIEAKNCLNFILTKTSRFLILQTLTGIDLSSVRFSFVPYFSFTEKITDEFLYKKYNFSKKDIEFIESIIRTTNGV